MPPHTKSKCALPECQEPWPHLRCSKCKSTWYCCKEHQTEHWKSHRQECKEVDVDSEMLRSRGLLLNNHNLAMLKSSSKSKDAVAATKPVHGLRDTVKRTIALRHYATEAEEAQCHAEMQIIQQLLAQGHASPRRGMAENDIYKLQKLSGSTLMNRMQQIDDQLRLLQHRKAELDMDVQATMGWECFESCMETRDVLENGERRCLMEAISDQPVINKDLAWEAELPDEQRIRLALDRHKQVYALGMD